MNLKKYVFLIAALAAVTSTAIAQWSGTVNGIVDWGDLDLEGYLSASMNITWDATADTVTVAIQNIDMPNSSSQLAGFWLLRPLSGGAPVAPDDPQGTLDEHPQELLDTSGSNPQDWFLDTDLNSSINGFGGQHDASDYFGARAGDRLDSDPFPGESGTFVFNFPDFGSWSSTADEGSPVVMVRWKTVTIDDGDLQYTGRSGKGGSGPGFEPGGAIPEPSEVALLSILGLGGLLWTRKRFMKKA